MALITTAYAGTADINEANLDALLNQLLPDGPLGMVYIPEKPIVKRNQPGLAKVVNWLQHNENGVGEEGTIPVPNLIQAMLERNEKLVADDQEPDELILVMVYNNASGLDTALVKEAHDNGIRVIDLGAAGDDIVPEDPEPPADEVPTDPTPPPAEEDTPPWEGDKPAESPAEAVAKAAEAGRAAAARRAKPTPAPEPPVTVPVPAPSTGLVVNFAVTLPPEVIMELARALAPQVVAAMGAQAQAVVEAPANLSVVPDLPVGDRGTNKADVAGQPPNTKPYYYNADEGKYRPARGVKRQNEERVFLTPAEVEEAKASKMLG